MPYTAASKADAGKRFAEVVVVHGQKTMWRDRPYRPQTLDIAFDL
jgi:hypothetical protein